VPGLQAVRSYRRQWLAKDIVAGVVGAVLITLMIVFVPGLFKNLPQPALAAVVITASLSLADIPGTVRLWRQRRVEFGLSIAAFLGVVLLGVLPGIAIAVGLSILNIFRRAWWPYDTQLGRVAGLGGYHDVHSYPAAEHLPGLVIYRFDAPLFFANAKTFRDEVRRLARADPPPAWIVIAAEPMTDVHTTASDVLQELDEGLNAQGISLVFAELKDPVRAKIERYGLTRTIDPRHFFPTIEAAIAAFRQQTGAHWAPAALGAAGQTAADASPAPQLIQRLGIGRRLVRSPEAPNRTICPIMRCRLSRVGVHPGRGPATPGGPRTAVREAQSLRGGSGRSRQPAAERCGRLFRGRTTRS
jgi:STAS domain/Sulfate permease family